MITVSVLYPNVEGQSFDMNYYVEKHIPLVKEKVGSALLNVVVHKGMGGPTPGSAPQYVAMAHMSYASIASFQEAFAPHGKEIMRDISNFTTIEPVIQISENA